MISFILDKNTSFQNFEVHVFPTKSLGIGLHTYLKNLIQSPEHIGRIRADKDCRFYSATMVKKSDKKRKRKEDEEGTDLINAQLAAYGKYKYCSESAILIRCMFLCSHVNQ